MSLLCIFPEVVLHFFSKRCFQPAKLLIRKNLHGALSETTLACDATDLHEVDHLGWHSNLQEVSQNKTSFTRRIHAYDMVQHETTW